MTARVPRRDPREAPKFKYDETRGEFWVTVQRNASRTSTVNVPVVVTLVRRHHAGRAGPTWFQVNTLPGGGMTYSSIRPELFDRDELRAYEREANRKHREACARCSASPAPQRIQESSPKLAASAPKWDKAALRFLTTSPHAWRRRTTTGPGPFETQPVQLTAEDIEPTSDLQIELFCRTPPETILVRVGERRERKVHRDELTRGFTIPARTLAPSTDSVAIGGSIAITAKVQDQELTFATIQAAPRQRGALPSRRLDYKRIRDLDTLDLPKVAHAAKKGSALASHFKDPALSLLFERLSAEARREIEQNKDEADVRERLVCLFRLLYETYLFNANYGQSLEISKWVDAARRHRKNFEAPYEVLKHEYEGILGRSHNFYHQAKVEARVGHKRITPSDARRAEQRAEKFRTRCARCKNVPALGGLIDGVCETCHAELTDPNTEE